MSEQELKKWYNKWKLWSVLNHDWNNNTPYCFLCQHVDPTDGTNTNCPQKVLTLNWDDAGEEWVKECNVNHTWDGSGYMCLEWIKDV